MILLTKAKMEMTAYCLVTKWIDLFIWILQFHSDTKQIIIYSYPSNLIEQPYIVVFLKPTKMQQLLLYLLLSLMCCFPLEQLQMSCIQCLLPPQPKTAAENEVLCSGLCVCVCVCVCVPVSLCVCSCCFYCKV